MAKEPKRTTPLRQVRVASGLSQKKFADLVGIKYDLYQSLELGRTPMQKGQAYKVYQVTGARPESLDHSKSHAALSAGRGVPYSLTHFAAWQKFKPNLEHDAWRNVQDLLAWAHFTFDVAKKQGKVAALHTALARALGECASACGLAEAIRTELAKTTLTCKVQYTYGELRRNKALAQAVGFQDRQYRDGRIIANDEAWEGTIRERAYWSPHVWFPGQMKTRLSQLPDESAFRKGAGENDWPSEKVKPPSNSPSSPLRRPA